MSIVTCPSCGAKNRLDESVHNAVPKCGPCGTVFPSANTDAKPVTVTDANFQQVISSAGDKPVLIDAWAEWCPPCKMLGPTIDKIAGESGGGGGIGEWNVDGNRGLPM